MTKIAIALRFFATGSFYETIADMFGVSKSAIEPIVKDVSYLIANMLRESYIYAPTEHDELLEAKVDFFRLGGFPLCIAAVDGTHIPIRSYGGEDAENYRNRKGIFSINVQLAVSANV